MTEKCGDAALRLISLPGLASPTAWSDQLKIKGLHCQQLRSTTYSILALQHVSISVPYPQQGYSFASAIMKSNHATDSLHLRDLIYEAKLETSKTLNYANCHNRAVLNTTWNPAESCLLNIPHLTSPPIANRHEQRCPFL